MNFFLEDLVRMIENYIFETLGMREIDPVNAHHVDVRLC